MSPPQSPSQMNHLQPRFPLTRPYSAPTSLSSSLEEQQFAVSVPSAKMVGKRSPGTALPPKVQGGGALGKLLSGSALIQAPANVIGKNNGRLGQGVGKAVGGKQELPSLLQKYSSPRGPLPLHAPLPKQQQVTSKASVSALKAGGTVPSKSVPHPMPVYGRFVGNVPKSADTPSKYHNPGKLGIHIGLFAPPPPPPPPPPPLPPITPLFLLIDLCAILAKHSLDHHFKLFFEQEVGLLFCTGCALMERSCDACM